jgi:hypothetical protein
MRMMYAIRVIGVGPSARINAEEPITNVPQTIILYTFLLYVSAVITGTSMKIRIGFALDAIS